MAPTICPMLLLSRLAVFLLWCGLVSATTTRPYFLEPFNVLSLPLGPSSSPFASRLSAALVSSPFHYPSPYVTSLDDHAPIPLQTLTHELRSSADAKRLIYLGPGLHGSHTLSFALHLRTSTVPVFQEDMAHFALLTLHPPNRLVELGGSGHLNTWYLHSHAQVHGVKDLKTKLERAHDVKRWERGTDLETGHVLSIDESWGALDKAQIDAQRQTRQEQRARSEQALREREREREAAQRHTTGEGSSGTSEELEEEARRRNGAAEGAIQRAAEDIDKAVGKAIRRY